jgi:hypothetical protein
MPAKIFNFLGQSSNVITQEVVVVEDNVTGIGNSQLR